MQSGPFACMRSGPGRYLGMLSDRKPLLLDTLGEAEIGQARSNDMKARMLRGRRSEQREELGDF